MMSDHARRAALGVALLLTAACAEEPTAPLDAGPDTDTAAPAFATLLTCTVDVAAGGDLDCASASGTAASAAEPDGAGAGPDLNLVVGSQHQFVRMANDPPTMEADTWSADVTVQNLTLQPMATLDGTTPEAEGVRVFFVDEPSNGVTIVNHDGDDVFTGTAPQKYYAYAGTAALGGDGILTPGEVSQPRSWEFDLDGATAFTFSVLIWTEAPDPDPAAYGVHLTRIEAGSNHTCGETADGRIYCWGVNSSGQLGNGESGTGTFSAVPVRVHAPTGVTLSNLRVGGDHNCADGSDGELYCWGMNALGQIDDSGTPSLATPTVVPHDPDADLATLVLGGHHTCAEGAGGDAYCWGYNGNGQLGNGSTGGFSGTPVLVDAPVGVTLAALAPGTEHTCAVGSDSDVYCWGHNDVGQLGDGTVVDSSTPVRVQAPVGVTLTALAPGLQHTCAEGSDGNVYCWGTNDAGQLGNGSTGGFSSTPVLVDAPAGVTLTALSAGNHFTCARGSDGQNYCWGKNDFGQIGGGLANPVTTPTAVAAPAGVELGTLKAAGNSTCAAAVDGPIYCWGSNTFGQLGDGTDSERDGPVIVAGTRGS